jgi:hypothetical protein
MMPSMDATEKEKRAERQRSFLLKLAPQAGHQLARLFGFTPPSLDAMELELRDVLTLWFKMQSSGALPEVADASWWMTKYLDHDNRMTREEAHNKSDELTSFAVAVIGQLLDTGKLQWVGNPPIPQMILSESYDPDTLAIDKAVIERLEGGVEDE